MRTIAAIILSVLFIWPPLMGQTDELSEPSPQLSIKAKFYTPASTPLFDENPKGLFFKDSSIMLASPMGQLKLSSIKTTLEMDSTATYFTFSTMMDGKPLGIPTVVSIDDYVQLSLNDRKSKLFRKIATGRLQAEEDADASQSFELIGADIAGQRVSLRVRGNVNITGKFRSEDRSKQTNVNNANQSNTFQIEQKQAFKIEGKIGDRISIQVDQDSERDFDFENNMEIYYNGNEDEIIQRVEAGNISLNLPGTKLAMFSGTNNGLFGLKTLAKVGPVDITAIASLERGAKKKLSFNDNDSEASEVTIDDYQRKANTYFYVNHFYRRKAYPLNAQGQYILSGRSIQTLRVYKYVSSNFEDRITNFAKIYDNPNTDTSVVASRQVIQLEQGPDADFVLYEDLGVIRLNTPVQSNEVLAIAYRDTFLTGSNLRVPEYSEVLDEKYWYQEGNDVALGTPGTADTLELKMIKPDGALTSDPSWDLEWKNVFYLKTTGINKDGFDLKIKQSVGGEAQESAPDGTTFLEMFGLDRKGVGAEPEPDGIVDLDYENIINFNRGELIFPYLNPFMAHSTSTPGGELTNAIGDSIGNGGNPNLNKYPDYQSSSFYVNPPSSSDYTTDSKFRIHVTYANQSSTFNLGFNVIEGSEEVTLNGVPLERGASRDYTIDYFTGQLIILNEAALAPGANLDIKYELNEFFQLDKKVILGTRAEMKFGEKDDSFIGLSAIYFSKSSIDEKVRVGKEPMENFIWDLNTKITKELPWLTRGIDWLPVVKTDATSSATLTGEIAQVIPNPNTADNPELGDVGVAYLDDFEGSRREAQLSIIRGAWGTASIPSDGTNRGNRERAFTYWYNPYNRVLTKQIWPNKETSAQAQNDVTDILVLNVVPDSSFAVRDYGDAPGTAWGGIMRGLSSGYYDQSESKFLEMWVKGDQGRLHVDLGYIPEDQQEPGQEWQVNILGETVTKGYGAGSDNKPDTEDIPSVVFPSGDGFIEEAEDLGLDGLPYTTPENIELYGYHHPAWDKYEFDPTVSPIDYRHINGTEGNLQIEGGTYPNTEDLNNDGDLSVRNGYFTIDVDLTTDEYIAGRTKFSDNTETGWKLVRVPLAEFNTSGEKPELAQWTQLRFARIWMDEVPMGGAALQIATVDIVGNDWQETGVYSQYDGIETVAQDSLHGTLNVIVINTEDNPSRYNADGIPGSYSAPPEGVEGILDPITQLRSKEQSLVVRADDLAPGYTVVADKLFQGSNAKDFIHYRTLKMFVHGWDRTQGGAYESTFSDYVSADGTESDLEFFFRFGETDDNFYEIRKPIFPGWDERNHLDVSMSDLANFKLALDDSLFVIQRTFVVGTDSSNFFDSTAVDTLYWSELPVDYKYASRVLSDGSTISVKGKPSLSRVKRLKTGFRNLSQENMTGEIWMDELRLSDIEKNTATAYRADLNMQFADLARLNMSVERQDADFHRVHEQFGAGKNSVSTNISGTLYADKLLPSSWGVNIPISATYSKSEEQPKYITASDIRIVDLDKSLRDTVETMTTRNESFRWNTSFSRREKSEKWLPKYTIDAMNLKVAASTSNGSNFQKRQLRSEKVDAGFGYKLNLGNEFKLAPFGFLESIPVIGETLAETEIGYLPTNVGFDGSVLENKSTSIDRNPFTPQSNSHQLSMSRRYNIDWSPLNSVTAKFSATLSNNLDSLRDRKEDIIKDFDFGHLGNYKETYSLSWSPKLLKILSPSFSYSSNFSADDKIDVEQPGLNLNVNANTTANMSLKVSDVFAYIHKPESSKKTSTSRSNTQTTRGRGRGREPAAPPPEKEQEEVEKEEKEGFSLTKILDFTYNTLDKIDPISMNVTQGRRAQSYRQIASYDSVSIPIQIEGDSIVYMDTLIVRELELENVGYGYRMGLDMANIFEDHPAATNPLVTGDDVNLTMRSGLQITKSLSTKLTFTLGQNNSIANKSQGEVVKTKMDFLPSGTLFGVPANDRRSFGAEGFPFPSFNLRYSGLKDIEWLKKYITSASLDMNYSGKRNANKEKGITSGESYSIGFSPLIGLNVSGKKKINGSLTYNVGKNINNTLSLGNTTSQQTLNQSVNASLSYAHSGGLKIALPMMEDKYLENNIDFRLEVAFTNEQSYTGTESETAIEFDSGKFTKSLSVRPSIQYSFTDKVSGSVSYDYRISETTLNGRQDVGDFQFGVNIQIKG